VTCPLIARIAEPEEMGVAKERLGKRPSAASNATRGTVIGSVFYAFNAEAI
jgi:hypothetical protein